MKEVEEDIRVIEARLGDLAAKTVKMPWERKEEKNLKEALGKLRWTQVSFKEHVQANPISAEIYQREISRSQPTPEDDKRWLLALTIKFKPRKKPQR